MLGERVGEHMPAFAVGDHIERVRIRRVQHRLDRSAAGPAARLLGGKAEVGQGSVSSYAELNPRGEPTAIDIVFSPTAIDGLPTGGLLELVRDLIGFAYRHYLAEVGQAR